MREIKFRVFDKEFKKTHIVGTNQHDSLTCFDGVVEYYNLQNGEGSGEHGDYILMQYTGLKDKNGKEIYEGDIINILGEQELGAGYSFNWNHNSVVKWDENNCCYYLDVIKKHVASICEDGFYTVDVFELRNWTEDEWWIEYENIGNIYENPELLQP